MISLTTKLVVGDIASIQTNNGEQMGLIEYIGSTDPTNKRQYVGINYMEPVENGHNGTVNDIEYFQSPPGHGKLTRISNIIRKLDGAVLFKEIQKMVLLYKKRLNQYVDALSERDEFIKALKVEIRRLKKQEKAQNNQNAQNNGNAHLSPVLGHTLNGMITPPPLNGSPQSQQSNQSNNESPKTFEQFQNEQKILNKKKRTESIPQRRVVLIEKHSEYTKWSDPKRRKPSFGSDDSEEIVGWYDEKSWPQSKSARSSRSNKGLSNGHNIPSFQRPHSNHSNHRHRPRSTTNPSNQYRFVNISPNSKYESYTSPHSGMVYNNYPSTFSPKQRISLSQQPPLYVEDAYSQSFIPMEDAYVEDAYHAMPDRINASPQHRYTTNNVKPANYGQSETPPMTPSFIYSQSSIF